MTARTDGSGLLTTPSASTALVVRGLTKIIRTGFFGRPVTLLHGVDLTVEQGTVFGFIGPNGAGKSTTIKTVIGAARPTSGTVQILGGDAHDPAVRKRIGYLPELPQLPPTLTPRELLTLHGTLARRSLSTANIDALLDEVGLLPRADDRVGKFSKGMQQRVGLALALVGDPSLLILDEPMTGLDPLGRKLVRDIIHRQKVQGRTVFFSSHVLSDVEALSDRVAILRQGRVVAEGPLHEVVGTETESTEVWLRGTSDVLTGLGLAYERRGDLAVVSVPNGGRPLDVAQACERAGAEVVEIHQRRRSLEDLVLALITSPESTTERRV